MGAGRDSSIPRRKGEDEGEKRLESKEGLRTEKERKLTALGG